MSIDFQASVVYILNADSIHDVDSRTAGTGFVVTADGLIVTCAHVIDFAQAGELVQLIFYHPTVTKENREIRVAMVVPDYFRDVSAEDLAFLCLQGPLPRNVVPLPLRQSFHAEGQTFRSFGFPEAKPEDGLLGECRVLGFVSAENIPLLQLRSSEISKGFSGAPLWDDRHQAVIGMVTSIIGTRRVKIAGTDLELPFDRSWRQPDTAFATPVETLRNACPLLQISDLCPYSGLDAFTEDDAPLFFGRERLIGRLLNRLRQDLRFLAVLGPSGSGKSSVVQAGLLPQLRQGAIGDSEYWRVIVTRPADDPFKQLATKGLMVASLGLVESVQTWLTEHPEQRRLVLVLDQFEELLTTCPEALRHDFVRQLTSLLGSPMPITVILVMRDDFYNQLVQQEALVEWLERSLGPIHIPHTLKWDEVTAIVQKPAEAVGLRFEEGLIETIVSDAMETAAFPVGEERIARSTILPLLEFALTELWQRREDGILSRRAYNAIGGVTGGLTQWADRVFYSLKTKEELREEKQREEIQRLAMRTFTDLVHIGDESQGLPDSRWHASLASLCRNESEIADVRQVVQQLVDGHLLVTTYDMQRKEEMVEIIHDALLWEWGQLRQWLQNDRDFLAWHQEFKKRVRAWCETNVDDPTKREEYKLFGGSDLTEALGWLAKRSTDLSQVERDFIQASQQRQRQQELLPTRYDRIKRRTMLGLIGTGVVIVTTGGVTADWLLQARQLHYKDVTVYTGHQDQVIAVVWQHDAKRIASGSADTTVQVWYPDSAQRVYTYSGHDDVVTCLAWSPDNFRIASGSVDTTAQVWLADGQGSDTPKAYTFRGHQQPIRAITWSPDQSQSLIATGGIDLFVLVWNPDQKKLITTYKHHVGPVNALAWSPDARYIASASGGFINIAPDNTVQVWEPYTGQQIQVYKEHARNPSGHVLAVTWSPDSNFIASADWPGQVHVWSIKDGHRHTLYEGHHSPVTAVSWSPDGKYIASASKDMTVQVWEPFTGHQIATYGEHKKGLNCVAWSPIRGDKRIVSGGDDWLVREWQLDV